MTRDELIQRARDGDEQALGELFERHRERLARMVQLRLDDRLRSRIDSSDVLQEAYLEVRRSIGGYRSESAEPLFLWLRQVVAQKLTDLHRFHLGTKMRDASREVSLYRGPMPQASSVSLAAQLLGNSTTASQAAVRAETRIRLQEALNRLDPIDREVLALRHFEQLSNAETAQVLGISHNAASNRYVRAVQRLKGLLSQFPDLADSDGAG